MTSRFISAGAIDAATGAETSPPPTTTTTDTTTTAATNAKLTEKQAAWAGATAQLEADRLRREQARQQAQAGNEKSLYEVLQANKAAKQAAFDEAHKLRNQFRALDDDEIEFLDEVRVKKRMEEEEARREVERGLEGFKAAAARMKREGAGVDVPPPAPAAAASTAKPGGLLVDYGSDDDDDDD